MRKTEHTPGPWHVGEVTILDRDTGQERADPHSAWVHNDGSFEASLISADALADAHLIAAAPDLLAALLNVQKLISEAAMTGFNCKDGDWADRLFHSQQKTSAAIAKTKGRS